MRNSATVILAVFVALGGCQPNGQGRSKPAAAPKLNDVPPVSVQQLRAYPETVTRRFVPLCDFEDVPSGPKGHEQVKHFSIQPLGDGYRKFVVNITRTGAGAMEVALMPRNRLVLAIPHVHDFTEYTLLSIALYSEALRDDLRVALKTDAASWQSHRTIVQPGWNNVLIDIQRLRHVRNFDSRKVRTLTVEFTDAAGQVTFNIDDIMLIDNRRLIKPTPQGVTLEKIGLDYSLALPGRKGPLKIAQSPDGLWRLGAQTPIVSLARPNESPAADREDLALMGPRRVGHIEVAEHNATRLRLTNIWYFPTRPGEWASLAVRQIRWDYTFYGDGRQVTHVELNNAGGTQIGKIRVRLTAHAAWTTGKIAGVLMVDRFAGAVGRWGFLYAPPGAKRDALHRGYITPGRIKPAMAVEAYASGDAGRDGFDESQDCYFVKAAQTGHCRFTIVPPPDGLTDAVFRIAGPWKPKPRVSVAGLGIQDVTAVADGSVLFILPGRIGYPLAVEVTGKIAPEGKQ